MESFTNEVLRRESSDGKNERGRKELLKGMEYFSHVWIRFGANEMETSNVIKLSGNLAGCRK